MVKRCPKVGIVVLNYKNYEDTLDCLRSLRAITYPQCEIVVVDNDSRNDSLAQIRESILLESSAHTSTAGGRSDDECRPDSTVLLQSDCNRGYAAGNNLGIREALARGAAYVLVLNNDTVVRPGVLEPLVGYAETHPDVGAVGPKIVDSDGRIDPSCARRRPSLGFYFFATGVVGRMRPNNRWVRAHYYRGEYAYDVARSVDLLSGACMLIRRSVFEQLGLLDERTFLYQEELILHERLRKAGWRQAIVPDSVIVHKGGRATGEAPPARVRQAERESLRYYLKEYRHYGWAVRTAIEVVVMGPPDWLRRVKTAWDSGRVPKDRTA
jgi:GT2 family glycosyltransferase